MIRTSSKNWSTGLREEREFIILPQKLFKCIRDSANGYWESEKEHAEREAPRHVEDVSNFTLKEIVPEGKVPFVEHFNRLEDITIFFHMIRAHIIHIDGQEKEWLQL